MKRWWHTPGPIPSARGKLHSVRRAVLRAAVAGAVSLPVPSQVAPPRTCCIVMIAPARTSGAVIQAWAFGTLSEATQPNSQSECDLAHVCALALSSPGGAGTGTGATIKTSFESTAQGEPQPNLAFTLTETIDYAHPTTKGVHGEHGQGACYPATGVMTVAQDSSSSLVLGIVGQACHLGISSDQLLLTGSYVTDSASSGKFANPDGVGSVSINTPSGLPGTGSNMKASLTGQLLYGN